MKEEGVLHIKPEILSSTVDICRDFLRNVCYRDKRCKYKHLTSEELLASVDTRLDPGSANIIYEFCHDFQNQGCDRPNCKFIHCSVDTEERFNEEGILPLRLKYEFELGVQELFVAPLNSDSASGGESLQEKAKPICRDYIQRQCRRGKKCRFAHVEQASNQQNEDFGAVSAHLRQQHEQPAHACNENGEKRIRLLQEDCSQEKTSYSPHSEVFQHIKEENIMLRKQVADLRKQVSGLSATNEVLLEQNAQFRFRKRMVEGGTPFSQSGKSYENQSTMAVSVPIAMSLSLPRQTQQLTNTPGLAGATLITSDPLSSVEAAPQTVSVRTHAGVPAQAHIQFPQNTATIVGNNQLVDDLQSLTNHQANVNPTQALRASVPVMPQVTLTGPTFSINQNTIPITQNMICSIPAMTTSSSGTILHNTALVNGTLTGQKAMTWTRSQATQNMAAASGLMVQSGQGITVEADAKSLGHLNHNIATAQMTHATLVTANQQDTISARPTPGDLSASIAAVAAQVIAAHAQPNTEMGTAEISLPTVPCVTLAPAPAIVPVTITTSLPVARMVPSLPMDNSSTTLLATRMYGSAQTPARVSMVNTCRALTLNASHQVINTVNGHCVVSSQPQLNAPINFTINPVPPNVSHQPGPGMHT